MNTISGIHDVAVISSFHPGVCEPRMREKLNTHQVESAAELWRLTTKCARAEEGRLLPGEALDEEEDAPASKATLKRGSGPPKAVLAADPGLKKPKPGKVVAGGPGGHWCDIHNSPHHDPK